MAAIAKATADFLPESALKKPYLEEYNLEDLRIDGGTQQREVDTSVIDEYAELILGGSPTPPGWVIFDGKDKWLWSGFHRYFANEKAKTGKMKVYVQKGTVRDAIWLSFSANKEHGVRRDPSVIRDVIAKIWEDAEWSKATAGAMAQHVGVSQRWVEKILSDLRKDGRSTKPASTERTVKRGGKQYTMNTRGIGKAAAAKGSNGSSNGNGQAEAPEAPQIEQVLQDDLGADLLDPKIIDVFTRRQELSDIVNEVSRIKVKVIRKLEPQEGDKKDPLFRFLDLAGWKADTENAYADLKFALPYALCPAHPNDATARRDCKWCDGAGWLTKQKHKLATEAMEAAANEGKK